MINLISKILKTDKIKSYILLLSFLIFVINIISLAINLTENKVEKQIINKEENRIMYIASNDETDRFALIKSLPNVQEVYYNVEPFLVKCNEFNNYYFKYFNSLVRLNRLAGNTSKLGYNEVIIPKTILNRYNQRIEDILNKKVVITIENQDLELIVSGIYSNDEDQGEYIYISNNSDVNKYIKNKNEYIVLIDDRNNYDKVASRLNDNGCHIEFIDNSFKNELQTYQDINKILNGFELLCYVSLVLVLLVLLYSNIVEKKYSIALLKTFGYSNLFILSMILLSFISMLLFSFVFSIFAIKFVDLLLFSIFKIKNFWHINILVKNCYTIFIILLLTIFITLNKIRRISIIRLLKD